MLLAIFASDLPLQEHAAIFSSPRHSRLRAGSAHTAPPRPPTKILSVTDSKNPRKNYKPTPNCETSVSRGGAPVLVTETACSELLPVGSTPDESPERFWARKLQPEGNLAIKPKELPRGLEEIFRSGFARGAKLKYFRQRKPEELGSLGRRRYLAVTGNHASEMIVREAKALVPSAIHWLEMRATAPSLAATLLQRAVRSPDPSLQVHDRWLIRQLAPDAIRLPVSFLRENLSLPAGDLIHTMGFESANIHLGSKSPAELGTALDRLVGELGADWLETATERMVRATREDQLTWEKHWLRANRSSKRELSAAGKAAR